MKEVLGNCPENKKDILNLETPKGLLLLILWTWWFTLLN